jgi:flagellar basal body-associated protein FliL
MSEHAVAEWVEDPDLWPEDLLEDGNPMSWRPRPPPWPLIAAAVGALVLGLGAGVGAGLLMNWLTAPVPEPPPVPHVVRHRLEPLSVNLRGDGGAKTLRIQAQVEVLSTEPEALILREPILRDAVISLASDYTAEDMLRASGKERFRRELTQRLDLMIGADPLQQVYLTELVVQ